MAIAFLELSFADIRASLLSFQSEYVTVKES